MKEDLSEIENAILKISESYSQLSEVCQSDFKNACKLIACEKGFPLVKEGQLSDKIYFINTGCIRAWYLKEGRDITDWFAFENDFFCSINSFFLFVPSPHAIEVIEHSRFLEISRDKASILADKHHDFERLTSRIAIKTMLQLQQRIVSVQFETAPQKYKNLIDIRPDITQRMPLTHIASYLGITLETLSRIRNPKKRI